MPSLEEGLNFEPEHQLSTPAHHSPSRFQAGVRGEQEVQSKRDKLAWKEDRVEDNSKQFGQKKELPGGFEKLRQMFEAASSNNNKKLIMSNTELVNMASKNKVTSGEVGRVIMSARKKVKARRASKKTNVIEKGFVQARIKKFMLIFRGW